MEFDGDAFIDRFNEVWNGHDVPGAFREFLHDLFERICDVLTLREGLIAAKRSYRKASL